jgi:hypothetical protein
VGRSLEPRNLRSASSIHQDPILKKKEEEKGKKEE